VKAAPFAYVRPSTLDDVLAELDSAQRDGGGKVIAGGQSLVPVLAMRLARPGTLVDINGVAGLGELTPDGDELVVGATVRQRRLEQGVSSAVPLVQMALPWVGHRELRSRGTVCGSLAHADPAAELPAVARCLGATIEISGPSGRRRVAAADFFTGAMSTAVGPSDVVTAVRFPHARRGEGFGFAEIARRHGDFALAGVATRVRVGEGGVESAEATAFGVADRPQLRDVGQGLSDAVARAGSSAGALATALEETAAAFADQVVTTAGDAHGSTGYRRRLLRVLTARELARAYASASDSRENS
jgi:2-furoyl-CoA dehydrogenase FAD binding subunit